VFDLQELSTVPVNKPWVWTGLESIFTIGLRRIVEWRRFRPQPAC
jgi:hypothetical protein